jgi:hypothetical protein
MPTLQLNSPNGSSSSEAAAAMLNRVQYYNMRMQLICITKPQPRIRSNHMPKAKKFKTQYALDALKKMNTHRLVRTYSRLVEGNQTTTTERTMDRIEGILERRGLKV